MNWLPLTTKENINGIIEASKTSPQIIFKHSTRCGSSSLILNRLRRSWDNSELSGFKTYLLNVIDYRELSLMIEALFHVVHQSPQILIIDKGKCIYHDSHYGIDYVKIRQVLLQPSL